MPVKRRTLITLLCCGFVLLGATKNERPPDLTNGALRAGPNIVIKDFRRVLANDGAADGFNTYYIVTFAYTNASNQYFYPTPTKFTVEATDNTRFFGTDSGSSVLIGISNDYSELKPGETRTFTLGFHVSGDTVGLFYYDPTCCI
jgi:hypothetical protein